MGENKMEENGNNDRTYLNIRMRTFYERTGQPRRKEQRLVN